MMQEAGENRRISALATAYTAAMLQTGCEQHIRRPLASQSCDHKMYHIVTDKKGASPSLPSRAGRQISVSMMQPLGDTKGGLLAGN